MEIKQLQYFVAAAESLSFTEAAGKCHTVQSGISQQIAALEKDLGVKLFIRDKRSLRLTREGEVLCREANVLLSQAAYTQFAVQSVSRGVRETLRIGRQGNLLGTTLPQKLRGFKAKNPESGIEMISGNTQALLEKLERMEIDCALSVCFPHYSLFDWMESQIISRESIQLMIPAGHPLEGRESVGVTDILNETLFLLSGSDKSVQLATWADSGYAYENVRYLDSQESIEMLVAAGLGVSPAVESVCRSHPDLRYVRMNGVEDVKIGILWNKRRFTPMLSAFLKEFDSVS